jgi:crotonobetainyl-CoA:carnitine CoA-transferase CaiB-like acyl-CoA transferase
MIGISGDAAFRRLCGALGNPQWAQDVRFRTNPDRVANTPQLDELITDVLRSQTVEHWTRVLGQHDVANDPVQDADQVLHDPQIAALGQLGLVELAGEQAALLARLPIGLSGNPPEMQGPPPQVGEHTRAILHESGFSGKEIDELLQAGVCGEGATKCKP